jgi:predicted Zn-dependent peptidase
VLSHDYDQLTHFERGPVERFRFANGASFLHHSPLGLKGGHFYVWFFCGSRLEKEGEEGLFHFIEHLVFKTRDPKTGKRYFEIIEALGGEVNAFTGKEYMCFELSGLSQHLEAACRPFLKMILDPNFDEKDFKEEAKVVIQEIKEDNDSHEYVAEENLILKTFSHPLGHPIAGSPKTVKSFTHDQVMTFFRQNFTPDRMVVSMVGEGKAHFFSAQLREMMEELGWTKPKSKIEMAMTKENVVTNHFKSVMKRECELSVMSMKTLGVPLDGEMRLPLTLIDLYLTDGMSSYLFKKLREEHGLIYSIDSELSCFTDTGCYTMQLSCLPKQREMVKQILTEAIQSVTKGIDEDRLELLKKQLVDYWELCFDDLEHRNEHFARGHMYREYFYSLEDLRKMTQAVTNKEIAYMAELMANDGFSYVEIVPKPKAKK